MQSARLPRPQHLSHIIRWSLMRGYLSPSAVRRSQDTETVGAERHIPTGAQLNNGRSEPLPELRSGRSVPKVSASRDGQIPQIDHLAGRVLIVRGVSQNLTRDDFERTFPELPSQQIKVFPSRSPDTFEKNGDYFLVFPAAEDALAWRRTVEKMHRIARKYSVSSLMAKNIAPPPGFRAKGEDVHKIINSFALVPAVSPLMISRYHKLSDYHTALAERGGYLGIVDRDRRPLHRVMLRVTGIPLRVSDLYRSIVLDGQRRNMRWAVATSDDGKQAASAVVRRFVEQDQRASAPDPNKHDKKEFGYGQRYLVDFETLRAAQQFSREWHRRPLPLPTPDQRQDWYSQGVRDVIARGRGGDTMVYTELLW